MGSFSSDTLFCLGRGSLTEFDLLSQAPGCGTTGLTILSIELLNFFTAWPVATSSFLPTKSNLKLNLINVLHMTYLLFVLSFLSSTPNSIDRFLQFLTETFFIASGSSGIFAESIEDSGVLASEFPVGFGTDPSAEPDMVRRFFSRFFLAVYHFIKFSVYEYKNTYFFSQENINAPHSPYHFHSPASEVDHECLEKQ